MFQSPLPGLRSDVALPASVKVGSKNMRPLPIKVSLVIGLTFRFVTLTADLFEAAFELKC